MIDYTTVHRGLTLINPQTDGRGNTSQVVYDARGRVAKTIDPLGNETTYTYDALGRQIAVTDPQGNTVTTTYDSEGRVLAQRRS